MRAAGYEYETTSNGGSASVSSRIGIDADGSEEVPVKNWEVAVNSAEKSLLRYKKILALGITKVDALKAAVDDNDPSNLDPTGDQAIAYALMSQGYDSFDVQVDVLRQTQICSTRNAAQFMDRASTGKIFSAAQLIELGCPGDYVEPEEDTTLEIPIIPDAYGYDLIYGYKKMRPIAVEQAGGKTQIVTEFVQGAWPDWNHEEVE